MNVFVAADTTNGAGFLLSLFVMLVAAKLMAELFERLRQPAVVGILVAQIGLGLAVINQSLYGVVVVMAVTTTLIAPPFLRLLHASEVIRNGKALATQ